MNYKVQLARGLAAGLLVASALALVSAGDASAQSASMICNTDRVPKPPDGCHPEMIESTGAQTVFGEKRALGLAWTAWQRTVQEKYGKRFLQQDLARCVSTECFPSGVGELGKLMTVCRVKGYACSIKVEARLFEPAPAEYEELGCKRADWNREKDVIEVGRREGRFSGIQIRSFENGIYIRSVKVIYANGTPDTLDWRLEIPANERSRDFDLQGDRRSIQRVELEYRSAGQSRERARVCVYGRK